MNDFWKFFLCTAVLAMFSSGCQSHASLSATKSSNHAENDSHDHAENDSHDHADHEHGEDGESDVTIAMGKLSPEDRKEAEAQKFCAVMNTSLLGSMGAPIKLEVKGQPVFVCCAGCKSKALKNPDKTLATVARLKAENGSTRE